MAQISPQPRRRIYETAYEVDKRLHQLHMTRAWVVEAAVRADVDRASAPIYGFDGHPEYAAGSRALSTLIEEGGTTDGGWSFDRYDKIPVAISSDRRVAIHPTGGTEGTGKADGEPTNRSQKGPRTVRVANAAQESLDLGDIPHLTHFLFLFTYVDDEGLWCELYDPLLDDDGYVMDFRERIIIGRIDAAPRSRKALPLPAPDAVHEVERRVG